MRFSVLLQLLPSALEVGAGKRRGPGARTFSFQAQRVCKRRGVAVIKREVTLGKAGTYVLDPEAILASTTSSLSVERLAVASGRPDRFVGMHVFNPVTKMELIELIFPEGAGADTRSRAIALCETFEKTPVEVPDIPGFVVNRLLFPYLFHAVRLVEETGMDPADVDTCMRLGAGHPMGPLALLDLVGLDVASAIGQTIGEGLPPRLGKLIDEGALGRKSGQGFHTY